MSRTPSHCNADVLTTRPRSRSHDVCRPIPGYAIIRKDRSIRGVGGGAAVYIDMIHSTYARPEIEVETIEAILVGGDFT